MHISPAQKTDAPRIATLIMMAMNHECCQNFAGPNHSLEDFHSMMTELVEQDNSQYSYRNTLTARDDNNELAGIIVGYDGKDLHRLRIAFIEAAKKYFDRDYSGMDDETGEGEFYIDSLAVDERYRHQGIATQLLKAIVEAHIDRQPVGLLVDKGNPNAEKLYRSLGFEYVEDTAWGGHEMRHLQASRK